MTAQPTNNAAAERSLLGALMDDFAAVSLEAGPLTPSDFTDDDCRTIFQAIVKLSQEGKPVSLVSVHAELNGRLPMENLERIADSAAIVAHVGFLADTIRAASAKRRLSDRLAMAQSDLARPEFSADAVMADLRATLEAVQPGTARCFSTRTWGDIRDLNLPPLTYFMGNCFALGRLHILFGQGGLGKSRVSLNIARNQVLGLPFANLPTGDKPLRHLMLGSENSIHRLQDDIRSMEKGLTPAQSKLLADHIVLATLEGPTDSNINLGDPDNIIRWRDTIRQHRPAVLWVDPWGDVAIGDQNDDSATRQTVSELLRLARTHRQDAAVVVLAHARTGIKNIEQATGYDAANFGKNSKALFSTARCVFNLAPGSEEENPPLIMVHAKSNDGPRISPFALRLDPDTHLYEADNAFDLDGWRSELADRANGRRRGTKPVACGVDKALELFTGREPATKTEGKVLLRSIGLTRDQAEDTLRQLLHAGRLESWTPAGKNMPTYIGTPAAIAIRKAGGGL